MLERVGVDAVGADHHHVIVERRRAAGRQLERFVAARGCDDRVRACNRRDDVFDHALRQCPSDALDLELLRAGGSQAEEPGDVIGVVGIELLLCEKRCKHDLLRMIMGAYHHAAAATRGRTPTRYSAPANEEYWRWCKSGMRSAY